MKSKTLIATAVLAAAVAAQADITETFPEVNGPYVDYSYTFPQPMTTIGTVNYSIPAGETILGATLSGIFGDTSDFYGSSAEFDLYANGTEVISTYDVSPDPYYNVVPFTASYNDIASLETGSVTLSYVQESPYDVRLSEVTLDIQTSSVPDVTGMSSVVMAGLGLAGFARRFARKG